MSGLIYSKAQSDVPYYIKEIGKNIYSIEELSFYLYNYLYLVDEDFFDEKLIDYIENQLDNTKVASGLRQAIEHDATLSEMVSVVIKNSGYHNANEIHDFQKQLDLLRASSMTERQKAKADILMNNRKFSMALDIYNKIAQNREPDISGEFYGNVYNNIGVVYANVFDFEQAKLYFSRAYSTNHDLLSLKHLIYAAIMLNEDLDKTLERYSISSDMVEKCKSDIEGIMKDENHLFSMDEDLEKYVENIKQEYENEFLI